MNKTNLTLDEWLTPKRIDELISQDEIDAFKRYKEFLHDETGEQNDDSEINDYFEPTGNYAFDWYYEERTGEFICNWSDISDTDLKKGLAKIRIRTILLDACQISLYDGRSCMFKAHLDEIEEFIEVLRGYYEKGEGIAFIHYYPYIAKVRQMIENYELGWLIESIEDFYEFAKETKILSWSPERVKENEKVANEIRKLFEDVSPKKKK